MSAVDRPRGYATDAATSKRMSAVRPVDTTPEKIVRKILTAMKFRYRLHGRQLPGRPDVVFPGRRKVIFVHGCYWHRHQGCARATMPERNAELWQEKFRATVERDERNAARLHEMGWKHLVVWECQVQAIEELQELLSQFLNAE